MSSPVVRAIAAAELELGRVRGAPSTPGELSRVEVLERELGRLRFLERAQRVDVREMERRRL